MTATNAIEVFEAAKAKRQRMIDNFSFDGWSDNETPKEMYAALESLVIWLHDDIVYASVATNITRNFDYLAANVLDVDTSDEIWRSSHILPDKDEHVWRFVLNCDVKTCEFPEAHWGHR